MTLSHIDGLVEDTRTRDLAFQMDEDLFRVFYERTSRGLAGYLVRLCGDRRTQRADQRSDEQRNNVFHVG